MKIFNWLRRNEVDILTKANFSKEVVNFFPNTNLCWLVINLENRNIQLTFAIWQDEINVLKNIITLPCKYIISNTNSRAKKIEITQLYLNKELYTLAMQDVDEFQEKILQILKK